MLLLIIESIAFVLLFILCFACCSIFGDIWASIIIGIILAPTALRLINDCSICQARPEHVLIRVEK